MSPLRNFLPTGSLVALAALALIVSTSACSESNFAGGSSNGSFGLNDKDKNGKGKDKGKGDANDGDSDADNDGGIESGNDADGGMESGNDSDGGSESGSDSDGGLEGSDGEGNDSDGDSDIGDDGGTTSKKTRSDLTIRQTRSDDKHTITVELMIKGKSVERKEVDAPGKGKNVVLPNMCRRDLDTCLKVTFSGDVPRVAGKDSCTFVKQQDKTTVKLDVDTNGAGFLGSCKADEDETHFLECPESKSLKASNCTG